MTALEELRHEVEIGPAQMVVPRELLLRVLEEIAEPPTKPDAYDCLDRVLAVNLAVADARSALHEVFLYVQRASIRRLERRTKDAGMAEVSARHRLRKAERLLLNVRRQLARPVPKPPKPAPRPNPHADDCGCDLCS